MRIGFRDTALLGIALVVAGSVLTARLGAHSSVWAVALAMWVTGTGLGLSSSPTLVAVQSVVGWERRGVVTGTNMFCRAMGSAIGAAALGALANATLADRFSHAPADVAGRLPKSADAAGSSFRGVGGSVGDYVRSALYAASHHVFLALLVTAVVLIGTLLLMPRRTEPLTF